MRGDYLILVADIVLCKLENVTEEEAKKAMQEYGGTHYVVLDK